MLSVDFNFHAASAMCVVDFHLGNHCCANQKNLHIGSATGFVFDWVAVIVNGRHGGVEVVDDGFEGAFSIADRIGVAAELRMRFPCVSSLA